MIRLGLSKEFKDYCFNGEDLFRFNGQSFTAKKIGFRCYIVSFYDDNNNFEYELRVNTLKELIALFK